MYTSYIGKKFLKIYRDKKKLPDDYTARQFFDEELFPLFFDNEKFFMSVHSSPFDQLFAESGAKFKKHKKENPGVPFIPLHKIKEHRVRKLKELHEKIGNGEIGGNTAVGYYTKDNTGTTSGQITSMKEFVTSEDMYSSWIGEGLGIRVDGGIILIDKDDVLWTIFKGWNYYRKYLSQTPNLKDKQIETWNGHWLNHAFGEYFHVDNPLAEFDPKPENVLGKLAIPTIDWIKVIFALSRQYPKQTLTAYIYNLSKTNTTLGFINIQLPKVKKLVQLKGELYTLPRERLNHQNFEKMYSTFYDLKNACKLGVIGMKALEPKNLRAFMPSGSITYAQGKDYKFSNPKVQQKKNEETDEFEIREQKAKSKYNEQIINFQIFKTWITAMLNNKKELNALAEQVAQALIDFEVKNRTSESGRGKATYTRLSEDVKASKSLREFVEKLTELMSKYKEGAEVFKKVKDTVLELPSDLFPLFITLIRFEYQFKKSINS